jgi:hypothetical protein
VGFEPIVSASKRSRPMPQDMQLLGPATTFKKLKISVFGCCMANTMPKQEMLSFLEVNIFISCIAY